MNEETLCTLYENFAQRNGWLSRFLEYAGGTKKDAAYLEWLDDQEADAQKKVRLLEKDVASEGGADIYFLETDEEKLDAVNKQIADIETIYENALRRDLSTYEKQMILWSNDYERLRKLRGKIRARGLHTRYPESIALTETEIVKAREVPLSHLVETNRSGFMLCPFHAEKTPSFKVKEWGYCFGCGKSCDAIGYLMQFKNLKFVDAIKALAS